MGILSKLFGGDKEAEKAANDLLSILAKANGPQQKPQQTQPKQEEKPKQEPQPQYDDEDLSEWEKIPAEECQYNFSGSFEQYFEHVFAEDFPGYRVEKAYVNKPDYKKRVAYSFYNGASKVLVIELMPESSEAKKFREDTKKAGISYLRFYYDHEGWWNTRTYVKQRIQAVL